MRWTAGGALALGLVFVAIDLWFQKLVDGRLEAIRRAGEPVAQEDLEWFYPPLPAEVDATGLWLEAVALLEQADAVYADAGLGSHPAIVGRSAAVVLRLSPANRTV